MGVVSRLTLSLLFLCTTMPALLDSTRSSYDYQPVGESPLLYQSGIDKVMNLDAETFYDTVLNSSTPVIVELYKDWCGFCRKFAPTYRAFAKSVENWHGVIAVTALNCADLQNRPPCRDAQRIGKKTVPSLKFFPAGATRLDEESEFDPPNRTVEAMRAALVKRLTGNESAANDSIRAFFGEGASDREGIDVDETALTNGNGNASLSAYLDSLWSSPKLSAESNLTYLVLVFEDANATFDSNGSNMTMGAQIRLDLTPYTELIKVLRLPATSRLAQQLKLSHFPHMAMFARRPGNGSDGPVEPLYSGEAGFNATKEVVRLAGLDPIGAQRDDPERDKWRQHMINCKKEPERCKKLYYVAETDMLRAVRMALYNEVLNRDVVNETHFGHLRDFVQLLIGHFPTSTRWGAPRAGMEVPMTMSENAHSFFQSLATFLDNHTIADGNITSLNGTFTADEWNTTFLALESTHHYPFPRNASWEHCKGTTQEYRGFTCGLWSAFHAMTVHAYLHQEPGFDPMKALETIRGWVDSFFSCHSCRSHFLLKTRELYPLNRTNVAVPEDVFLYLWRIHNRVNHDLSGDATEDPQFKKQQFPAEFICPQCRSSADEDTDCFHTDGGKRAHLKGWDEWAVKEFLTSYYSQIKPRQQY